MKWTSFVKRVRVLLTVTETEVQHGLLEPGTHTENSAIWLKREIDDIDKLENNYAVSRYKGT